MVITSRRKTAGRVMPGTDAGRPARAPCHRGQRFSHWGGKMRAIVLAGSAMLGLSASLAGQHGRSYEFGMFGAYTRYDATFGLPNRIGGGVRLGYMFSDMIGAEAEVLFPSEYTVGTSTKIDPLIA